VFRPAGRKTTDKIEKVPCRRRRGTFTRPAPSSSLSLSRPIRSGFDRQFAACTCYTAWQIDATRENSMRRLLSLFVLIALLAGCAAAPDQPAGTPLPNAPDPTSGIPTQGAGPDATAEPSESGPVT